MLQGAKWWRTKQVLRVKLTLGIMTIAIIFSGMVLKHNKIMVFLIYANKTKYLSVLLPLHPFPVISKLTVFCVKKTKHNNPKVRNTIYLKMKTAPAKFHFGSDGSSSIEESSVPSILSSRFFFFLRERSDRSKTAAVTPGINMRHLRSGWRVSQSTAEPSEGR